MQGPDGVGKTSTNSKVNELLNSLPINFLSFHHITGWKKNNQNNGTTKSGRVNLTSKNYSLTHNLLRFVYRRLFSENMRSIWLDLSSFSKYVVNTNKFIFDGRSTDRINLSDRYIEDMYIKTTFAGHPKRWILLYRIANLFVERPTKSFLLEDTPENITARKKELSVSQILSYYTEINSFFKLRNTPLVRINVERHDQEMVARIILLEILHSIGPQIIRSIKHWKQLQGG